jgi:hypothetical protein
MKLRILIKLMELHRYPRYFRVLLLHCENRLASKRIQRQIKLSGVSAPSNVVFYGMPIVSIVKGSKIEIGENCVICSDPKFTDLGLTTL